MMVMASSLAAIALATPRVPLASCGVFGYAHRAVPYDGLGIGNFLAEQFHGLRADIQTHFIRGNLVGVYYIDIQFGVDRIGIHFGANRVDGQQQFHALFFGFLEHIAAVIHFAFIQQGLADLMAHGLQEGEGHAAADDQRVGFIQQVFNHVELVRHFGTAQDANERTLGIFHSVAQVLEFFAIRYPTALSFTKAATPTVEQCAR